jgi:hypothetical protein
VNIDTARNRFAVRLCNRILRLVASREYREALGDVIDHGLRDGPRPTSIRALLDNE